METIIATLATSASGKDYLTLSRPSHLPGLDEELVIPMAHSVAIDSYEIESGQPLPENDNTKALVSAFNKKFSFNTWNS